MGYLWAGLLAFGSLIAGLVFLIAGAGRTRLPEWCFPVRGRWLRYLSLGIGLALILPIFPPVVPLGALKWLLATLVKLFQRWICPEPRGAASVTVTIADAPAPAIEMPGPET